MVAGVEGDRPHHPLTVAALIYSPGMTPPRTVLDWVAEGVANWIVGEPFCGSHDGSAAYTPDEIAADEAGDFDVLDRCVTLVRIDVP